MDVNTKLIDEMKDNTGKVRQDVESVNKSLKAILEKMRSPNKFCCDIVLMVVLAVMIGTLVWAIRFYINMDSDGV